MMTRRHDLDALRAFAMLLGIGLHAALSFMPMLWPVQDSRQNDLFSVVVAAVHGFRMPVFFVMSGFFTAMLWRQRGLRSVLGHRFRRIFLPLLLGMVTVVPAVDLVARAAILSGSRQAPVARPADGADVNRQDPESGLTPLSLAVIADQTEEVRQLLHGGAEAGAPNGDGSSPLAVAALLGRTEAAGLLIQEGADIDARAADGSTPLHTAAFFGRAETVELLIQEGADTSLTNKYGQTALEVTTVDWKTTQFIAAMVKVEVEREEVEAGRSRAAESIRQHLAKGDPGGSQTEGQEQRVSMLARKLMFTPFFHHLWFLWFLCWLVAGFGVYAWLADRLGWKGVPNWLLLSPVRFLWLIPLTMVPQWFMGMIRPVFGADLSEGILPMPHVLAFYAVFFGFGALYFDRDDDSGRVGRWWWLSLPLGLLIIYPLGLEFSLGVFGFRDAIAPSNLHRPIAALLQVTYAWMMTFGLMGLFRRLLTRENHTVRYISDSSYWLYLAHLPLMDWPLPAMVKFTLICGVVTVFLLITYQTLVRYRWLGRFLNGPRQRPERIQPVRAQSQVSTTGGYAGVDNSRSREADA
jgi:hypothetical protein